MKPGKTLPYLVTIALSALLFNQYALAAGVKITPLGSQQGEFCQLDRALVLEDPDGTRILYDPGRTVAGAEDPRLGKIDVILVSHMHGDHVGNKHIDAPGDGDCKSTNFPVNALPNTNAASIALHEKLGFTRAGVINEVAFKFGRWLDLAFYQLILETPEKPMDG